MGRFVGHTDPHTDPELDAVRLLGEAFPGTTLIAGTRDADYLLQRLATQQSRQEVVEKQKGRGTPLPGTT